MQYSLSKNTTRGIFLVSSLLSPALAELLSCADIGCPTVGKDTNCSVNGTRLTDLGVSNFSTSLSPKPLSWTVGYVNGTNGSEDRREFYLGMPSNLDLSNVSSVSGCSLVFTGTTYASMDKSASGNCSDGLGASCTSQLLKQAQEYTELLKISGIFQCSTLAQMLQDAIPSSCLYMMNSGRVIAQDLTGPKVPAKLQLDQCHPTMDRTYDLRTMGSFSSSSHELFFREVTPVMTVFTPNKNSTGNVTGPVLNSTQVDLRCMRPVANQGSNESKQPPSEGSAPKELSGLSLGWTVLVAFLLLVLL